MATGGGGDTMNLFDRTQRRLRKLMNSRADATSDTPDEATSESVAPHFPTSDEATSESVAPHFPTSDEEHDNTSIEHAFNGEPDDEDDADNPDASAGARADFGASEGDGADNGMSEDDGTENDMSKAPDNGISEDDPTNLGLFEEIHRPQNMGSDRRTFKVPTGAEFSDFHRPLTLAVIEDLCRESPFPVVGSSFSRINVLINDLDLEISLSEGAVWLLIKTSVAIPNDVTPFPEHDEELNPRQIDEQLHLLIDATNAWNRDHFQPTAYVDRVEDAWVIRLDNAFFVGAGITTAQFASALARAATFSKQAAEKIPGLIPPI